MFRKALFPLLCAATFAAAIPLHIGESWVWQVTNRDNLDLTYRTAVVVDSQSLPVGKVWTVVARDSVSHMPDTAKILVWPSGRQTWLRQSRFLSWELQPRDPGDTSIFVIGGDTTSIWGEASSLTPGVHSDSSPESGLHFNRFIANGVMKVCDSLEAKKSTQKCVDVAVGVTLVFFEGKSVRFQQHMSVRTNPAPIHVWSDTLGMERALTFYRSVRGHDWRLVSHNRRSIALPKDELRIPAPQTVVSWIVQTSNSSGGWGYLQGTSGESTSFHKRLRWKFASPKPDSAGWTGIGISQISETCLFSASSSCFETKYAPPTCTNSASDTICEPPVFEDLVVRIHPGQGQSFSNATNVPPLQISWIRPWETSAASDTSTTLRSWDKYEWSVYYSLLRSYKETWKEGALTSWSSSLSEQTGAGGLVSSTTTTAFSFELIGIYPPGTELPSSIRSKASNITSLKDLAHTFPNTPIRWSTAAGRTGTIDASEIVYRPAALRGKTLFLQARLPDGRVWQGTHVVP